MQKQDQQGQSRSPGAESKPVTDGTLLNFRGPQALLELTGGEADSVTDANGARRIGRAIKWVQRTCSQNDFHKNRRLLVDSTSCAGIKSNGLRGPRCKPSLQFCIPFDTILVRPYKLSHDESE